MGCHGIDQLLKCCARSTPGEQVVPRRDEIEKLQLLGEIAPGTDGCRASDSGHVLHLIGPNTQAMTDQPTGMGCSRVGSNTHMDCEFLLPLPRYGNAVQ
jgi:hypothetical protein